MWRNVLAILALNMGLCILSLGLMGVFYPSRYPWEGTILMLAEALGAAVMPTIGACLALWYKRDQPDEGVRIAIVVSVLITAAIAIGRLYPPSA